MKYAKLMVSRNWRANRMGSTRTVVVSWMPEARRKKINIGKANKKWMKFVAMLTIGRTAIGKPGLRIKSRLSTIEPVAIRSEDWNQLHTRIPVKRNAA